MATKSKTPAELLARYEELLQHMDAKRAEYEAFSAKFDELRSKYHDAILSSGSEVEVSDYVRDRDPYFAWQLAPKTDASAILSFRMIRDNIAASNKAAKDYDAANSDHLDKISAWLLRALNDRGQDSFRCVGIGSVYKQEKLRVSATDFDAYIEWAAEQGVAPLVVQKRLKSDFVDEYYKEHGTYPPFLNVHREIEVIVRKS